MMRTLVGFSFVTALFVLFGVADAQEKKKRTGKLIGEVQSLQPTPNKKNVQIEVLAAGEEKARSYRVMYDPKVKGPNAKVLERVRSAKQGDRVQLEWVDTGEGLAITAFEVLKKAAKD